MLLQDRLESANQLASNSLHLFHKGNSLFKARQSTDVTSKHSKTGVVFETGSSTVAQTDPEFRLLLHQPMFSVSRY